MIFDLLFSGLYTLIVPIIAIIWFFWYVNKDDPTTAKRPSSDSRSAAVPQPNSPQDRETNPRDAQWRSYLESFKKPGLSKAESALLDRLLNDMSAPGAVQLAIPVPDTPQNANVSYPQATQSAPATKTVPAPRQEVDGTLLLLYFGAFLFVAAAGLFVAFSGISGVAKTAVVMATMYIMYMVGIWLFNASKRLRLAGVTFAAIGMAIAPLIGFTAHYYVAQGQYVPIIWGATSLLCVALYAYALSVMKYTFISYFFIFSFLSLFESAVAVVQAPLHYYIWVLILAGLILKFAGIIRENQELRQPAAISAHVIIPLSILVSFGVLEKQGRGQLGVTLLLAAVYYTLEALRPDKYRPYFAAAAQVLYLGGFALAADIVFASDAVPIAAICLMVLTVMQAIAVWYLPSKGEIPENFASIAFIAALPAVYLADGNGTVMTIAVALIAAIGVIISVRQRRSDAYAGAALASVLLPFVAGLFAASPRWSSTALALAAFVPVVVLWAVWRVLARRGSSADWQNTALTMFCIAGLVTLLPALGAGGWVFMAACAVLAAMLVLSADVRINKQLETQSWAAAAGVLAGLPVLRELYAVDRLVFTAAAGLALATNIYLALRYKTEWNRWLGAGLGLVAPVAIGAGGLGFTVDQTGYAYLYLLAMCILVFGRGIARGVYLFNSRVPLSSLYKSASLSYVIGYVAAAILSLLLSLGTDNSRLHTSILLGFLLLVVPYIAVVIEKQKRLLAFTPWIALLLLMSAFRPSATTLADNGVILFAAMLGVLTYYLVRTNRRFLGAAYDEIAQTTLIFVFAPLIMCLWYQVSDVIPPITLAVAGLVVLYHAWQARQADREASGGILVVALMWALFALGVHNLQAHTHIVAVAFALYAYWRFRLGDRQNSDNYLYAMLATATIPLALQAIAGRAGDAYGWWLLLEQVGFMVLGITIHRRFVTFWGLYVAVAAVLYQLRHLGWAALSFLALFVIGLAVYRLLKSSDNK